MCTIVKLFSVPLHYPGGFKYGKIKRIFSVSHSASNIQLPASPHQRNRSLPLFGSFGKLDVYLPNVNV